MVFKGRLTDSAILANLKGPRVWPTCLANPPNWGYQRHEDPLSNHKARSFVRPGPEFYVATYLTFVFTGVKDITETVSDIIPAAARVEAKQKSNLQHNGL